MVLPVKELPHFEGTKREDVITFIWSVDEIAQLTSTSSRRSS